MEILLFNVHDNLATRKFNDVEKAMILSRLILLENKREILEDYMPLIHLPSHESTLDTFLRLEELDHSIKTSLVEGRISFKTIKALLDVDPDSRAVIFHWISKLKFNFNQQLQFIDNVTDISIKEKITASELLGDKPFSRIWEDKKMNNPQKTKSAIEFLRSRRFPVLTDTEKRFQKMVSTLDLPDGVTVNHSPFFEDPDYRLEIRFRTGKELKKKIDILFRLKKAMERIGDPWQENA